MSAQVFSTDWIVRGTVAALTALLVLCAGIVVHAAFTHDDRQPQEGNRTTLSWDYHSGSWREVHPIKP